MATSCSFSVSTFTLLALVLVSSLSYSPIIAKTRPRLGLDIAKVLKDGRVFNIAGPMLKASGVEEEIEDHEGGAGITLFVPIYQAFFDMPYRREFQSLSADRKAMVMRYHVLHSYYPLGKLEKIVNPINPTFATESMWAESFTLNISRINGSLVIDTGIVQARVTQTVFDQTPLAIFGISEVLLPKEYFGSNPIKEDKKSGGKIGC